MRTEIIRSNPSLTTFDPIKDTLGTADRQTVTFNGSRRDSIVGLRGPTTGGSTVIRAGGLPRSTDVLPAVVVTVPSLPRRNYLPVERGVEFDD